MVGVARHFIKAHDVSFHKMNIFVSIASYKDPLLWKTVDNCLSNALHPENIYFGIVDQSDTAFNISQFSYRNKINYICFDPIYSRGPCWARSIAHSFYNNQTYVLQIDSHTVFDQYWDDRLIQSLNECLKKSSKVVISSYPRPFEIINDEVIKNKLDNTVMTFRPNETAAILEHNPVFAFISVNVVSEIPILGYHVAGGFIFTSGNFFQEIPYDPQIYFLGEEQNIAIRAWTHGWDIYHISEAPLYHLYYKSSNRPLHWDNEDDKNRSIKWVILNELSRNRMCDLLLRQKNLGIYGLGHTRSLREFSEFSGINYIDKTINTINNIEQSRKTINIIIT